MKKYLILLIVFFLNISAFSQEPSDTSKKTMYKIVRHDGVEYIGEILSDDGREVLLKTEKLGEIYIPKSEIAEIKEISPEESIVKGNFREAGPFTTRYYFTNNALPIKKNQHYAMLHLYGPEAHFALSDNFSLGVMATWIASPIGVAAKYSIPTKKEKLHFSLGTIMFNSGYIWQARGWGGLHWGSVTFGEAGKNVTLSSGFGYVDLVQNNRSEYESGLQQINRGSVSSISALFPVGESASFIFDSMISISEQRNYQAYSGPGTNQELITYKSGTQIAAFLMPGMRFQSKPKRAFQVALAGVFYYSSIGFNYNSTSSKLNSFPVPMCSWFFKF